MESETFIN